MADKITSEVKLSPPVILGNTAYTLQFTELAGRIVKVENGKLYIMDSDGAGGRIWELVKDAK